MPSPQCGAHVLGGILVQKFRQGFWHEYPVSTEQELEHLQN